jgi:predicted esterase
MHSSPLLLAAPATLATLATLAIGGHVRAQEGAAAEPAPTCLEWLRSGEAAVTIPLDQVAGERARLWAKYREEQRADPARREEHEKKAIQVGARTMRYAYSRIGDKPPAGYPLYIALHGGGGAPARVNDSQWIHMKRYYKSGVKTGVYLAARGVTNTWNLHSVDESFPCYDRLIENMILFEDVDPNRVYILGFSAGGDGTYQIATRMADRFAAANMSAGHPNGVNPRNLCNVAFLLQMGENDKAYGRNKQAVQFYVALRELRAAHPGYYVHAANIHFGKPHNFSDNHPNMVHQRVLADPAKWLADGDRTTVTRNTHAIAWLDGHARNPTPRKVIWDLTTRATSRGKVAFWPTGHRGDLHYWLDLSGQGATPSAKLVIARLDKAANTVVIETCGDSLRVLLKHGMLDLARPVHVEVGGRKFQVSPRPNRAILLRTMIDRGDPNFMFEASITIQNKHDAWTVTTS